MPYESANEHKFDPLPALARDDAAGRGAGPIRRSRYVHTLQAETPTSGLVPEVGAVIDRAGENALARRFN